VLSPRTTVTVSNLSRRQEAFRGLPHDVNALPLDFAFSWWDLCSMKTHEGRAERRYAIIGLTFFVFAVPLGVWAISLLR
jgi:hypothetical protein